MMTPVVTNPLVLAQIALMQVQRAALVSAIAAGVTNVSYEGKTASYRSLTEMKQALNFLDAQIAALAYPGYRKPQAGFAYYNRGERRRGYGYGGFYGFM